MAVHKLGLNACAWSLPLRAGGLYDSMQAPAANHRGNQQSLVETFSLANISPQVGKGFNRDFWARCVKVGSGPQAMLCIMLSGLTQVLGPGS